MGRPETPINPEEGPLQSFAHGLRALRRAAGNPSYRQLATRANYSGTSLSEAARGLSLPSLDVTLSYVRACGGDTGRWEQFWLETEAALADAAAPRPGRDAPRTTTGGETRRLRAALPTIIGLLGTAGLAGAAHRLTGTAVTILAGGCLSTGFLIGRVTGRRPASPFRSGSTQPEAAPYDLQPSAGTGHRTAVLTSRLIRPDDNPPSPADGDVCGTPKPTRTQ
ncbi:helix-turn-helix domain-containing protein [Streptomyces sp. NPDC058239]|uniref:helix-turn-helix domain-containing protein n=1 Tax=Streptomyces sp. NPDC058239 TaxID=3346395 RepID=UPI0036EB5968